MPNVEILLQNNCRYIVRVCGKALCKPGKQLPREFRTKEAAAKAGEAEMKNNRFWANT